jgi:hypothetical protein
MPRAISYETYKQYAKRYKIPLSNKINGRYKRKNIRQLSEEIYAFETAHEDLTDCLYYTND